jgi:peptidoglycan-N-acetylglucosamine deacetylase
MLFARDTFLFIIFFSYILGSLPTERVCRRLSRGSFPFLWEFPGGKKYLLSFLANMIKGAAAVMLARLLIGTAMAQALAGLAVLTGHYWSCFTRLRGGTGIGVLFGVLLVFAPQALPYLVIIWVVSYLSFEKVLTGSIITVLALPVVMWQVKRFDLYIVFGILATLMVGYHLLGENGQQKKIVRQVAFIVLISSILTTGFFSRYVYRGFGVQLDMIRHGNPELPFVAITFDDGPDPAYTPAILDILAEHNVKATFFMVGKHVALYPDIARRIVEEGHSIGNHTQTHRNLSHLNYDKILEEIILCELIIEEVTGQRPYYFRPPRGMYNSAVREIVSEREYTMVLWSISSQDWRESSSRIITQNILDKVCGGDILLFHDSGNLISAQGGNRYNTVTALSKILAGLEEKGLIPVTMQEMLIIKGFTYVDESE